MDGARSAARTIQNNLLDSSKQVQIYFFFKLAFLFLNIHITSGYTFVYRKLSIY